MSETPEVKVSPSRGRLVKSVLGILAAAFVLIQFHRPAKTNPPEDPASAWSSRVRFTPEVTAILDRSCANCHSHRTQWPWYSNIAPMSWSIVHHVEEGREHLNLSSVGAGDEKKIVKRLRHKLEEMGEEIREGEMPLKSYLFLHPEARLSTEDVNVLSTWADEERARLEVLPRPDTATDSTVVQSEEDEDEDHHTHVHQKKH